MSNNQKVNNRKDECHTRDKKKFTAQAISRVNLTLYQWLLMDFQFQLQYLEFRSHHSHDNKKWLYKLKINEASWICQRTDVASKLPP